VDPFEFIQWLWDDLSDPTSRTELLKTFAISLALVTPIWLCVAALRRYAKAHGREIAKADRPRPNAVDPFADARLNEVLGVIRRRSIPVMFAVIAIGVIVGTAFGSDAVTWAAIGVGYIVAFLRTLFLEACIAFGAELAPVESPSIDGVPGTT
jgi:hypothetical protein